MMFSPYFLCNSSGLLATSGGSFFWRSAGCAAAGCTSCTAPKKEELLRLGTRRSSSSSIFEFTMRILCDFGRRIRHGKVNLQRFIHKASYRSFLVGQYCWQRDVAFEVTDLDDHFITFFCHQYLFHLNVRQRQAEHINIPPSSTPQHLSSLK